MAVDEGAKRREKKTHSRVDAMGIEHVRGIISSNLVSCFFFPHVLKRPPSLLLVVGARPNELFLALSNASNPPTWCTRGARRGKE
jgi:hypothetical protein